MTDGHDTFTRAFRDLQGIAPLGYSVGLDIRFATPQLFKSTYPDAWQETYSVNGYALRDPLVFWGISHVGTCRWGTLDLPDPFGVLEAARRHGLRYGGVASCGEVTSRTIIGVARSDREFDETELATVERIALNLHGMSSARRAVATANGPSKSSSNDGIPHPSGSNGVQMLLSRQAIAENA